MSEDGGMVVPEWAEGAERQILDAHQGIDYESSGVKARELKKVLHFSTLFAEYEVREDTLLLHVFPRAGADDQYRPAEYRDGKVYIPGRLEEKATVDFPISMKDILKTASDKAWMGDVAIDYVPELGAYVLQFQGAKNTVEVVGVAKFVDTLCGAVDEMLEPPQPSE